MSLVLLALPAFAAAKVFVVNTTVDSSGIPDEPICEGPGTSTTCNLREAITLANEEPDADSIQFGELPAGQHQLEVSEVSLPTILNPVTIEGDTAPGASPGTPALELVPTGMFPVQTTGFEVGDGTGTRIEGFAVGGFTRGIEVIATGGSHTADTQICGNYIGTDLSGEVAAANVIGVDVDSFAAGEQPEGTEIGGPGCAANLIAGNSEWGVFDDGIGTTISGNRIGVDREGAALPNGSSNSDGGVGVGELAAEPTIGGTAAAAGNTIANNEGSAVFVQSAASRAAIRGNSMFENSAAGIAIVENPPVPPTVTNAFSLDEGELTVVGEAAAAGSETISLDFFASETCDLSGFGEGQTYLGSAEFAAAPGSNPYSETISANVPAGEEVITATATGSATHTTTEFSNCQAYTPPEEERTFTVTTTEDLFGGPCEPSSCSLQQAIEAANATPVRDTIDFAAAAEGTMAVEFELPKVTAPVEIDGTSAPNYGGTPVVTLDGSGSASTITDGLTFWPGSSGSVVRGLAIGGFGTGIFIEGNEDQICDSYLGVEPDGVTRLANEIGVEIWQESSENRIGAGCGSGGVGNLLSGNSGYGIADRGTGTQITGNRIGFDATGAPLPNGTVGEEGGGIVVGYESRGARIGGVGAGQPNTIAYNHGPGVRVGRSLSIAAIRGNAIFDNDGLGIEVELEPPPPPTVESVVVGAGTVAFAGDATGEPGGEEIDLDFFANETCDPSGAGEGQTYLGSFEQINPGGATQYETGPLPGTIPTGENYITVTATGSVRGQTTEFSTCYLVEPPSQTFTVTTRADTSDGECGTVCSLRDAVEAADESPARDTIDFAESAEGRIEIDSFPIRIYEPVTIDGTSAPNYAGRPVVLIDGTEALNEGPTSAFEISEGGAGTTVEGLAIGGFGRGVGIDGSATKLCSDWFGVELDGTSALPNLTGVVVEAQAENTVIGDGASCGGNLISGNSEVGIVDDGTHTVIEGNLIGTDAAGTGALPNGSVATPGAGVVVGAEARRSTVGQLLSEGPVGSGNVIAHNKGAGVLVESEAVGTSIRRSAIYDDAGGAIVFETPNGVPSPEVESFAAGPTSTTFTVPITGGLAGETYEIDVFANAMCQTAGYGPAEVPLGSGEVTVDPSGDGVAEVHGRSLAGIDAESFTATATETSTGTTSQLSTCRRVAPTTQIDSHPPAVTHSTTALFSFSGSDTGHVAGFECSLDGAAFSPCASPAGYSGLGVGTHTFEVAAVDEEGTSDPTPVAYTWKIVAEGPPPTITTAPPTVTESSAATFEFGPGTGTSGTTTFECSLDGAAFAPCTSPQNVGGLAPGTHTFAVRSVDEAEDTSEPTVYSWSVAAPKQQEQTQQAQNQQAPPATEEPEPSNGEKVVIAPEEGKVLVKLPGSKKFVNLEELKEIPVGAIIDATAGKVKLTSVDPDGTEQSADFFGGVFKVKQKEGSNLVVLELLDTNVCTGPSKRSARAGAAATASAAGGGGGKLWGSGHGNFRTEGNQGSATVRGTIWLVEDRCNGTTFFRTRRGIVSVRDFTTGKTVPLPAGKTYLAGE